MSNKNPDELIKKYLAAESTLAEEDKLFNAENQQPGLEEWATYVKLKRKKVPTSLNATIREAIQARKRKKQRFIAGLSGIAASMALFIAFFINNMGDPQLSYQEKEVLLNEALSMFADEKNMTARQVVLYEDDMIIIYTASKY